MNHFKNLLNLKKKDPSDIVIVEKIVLKNRSLFFELARMLVIIAVASGIVWGISNADNLPFNISQDHPRQSSNPAKNFSAMGTVSEITDSSLSLENAKGSNDKTQTSYTFNISNTGLKIQDQNDTSLNLLDIKLGDRIVVQGTLNDGVISIRKIISFATTSEVKVDVATSTASTTEELGTSTATTTDIDLDAVNGSSTPDTSSSTASTIDDSSSTTPPTILENIINTATTTLQNIIDVVTGTGSSTLDITPATTTSDSIVETSSSDTPTTNLGVRPPSDSSSQ